MTFCASSVSGTAAGACSTSVVGGGGGGAAAGFGTVGASSDARIREIGGRTVLFFLVSPSVGFFGAGLSINETLSTSRRAGFGAAAGAGLAAGLCSGSFFLGATFA